MLFWRCLWIYEYQMEYSTCCKSPYNLYFSWDTVLYEGAEDYFTARRQWIIDETVDIMECAIYRGIIQD